MKRSPQIQVFEIDKPLISFLPQNPLERLRTQIVLERQNMSELKEKLHLEEKLVRELERKLDVAQKLAKLKSIISELNENKDSCDDTSNSNYEPYSTFWNDHPPRQCLCGSKESHATLAHCPIYMQLESMPERWQMLKTWQVCFRCLVPGHKAGECLAGPCGIDGCKRRHHPTLHDDYLHGHPPSAAQYLYFERPHI